LKPKLLVVAGLLKEPPAQLLLQSHRKSTAEPLLRHKKGAARVLHGHCKTNTKPLQRDCNANANPMLGLQSHGNSPARDLYAAGITLSEAVIRQQPRDSHVQRLEQIHQAMKVLGAEPWLQSVVKACTSAEPKARQSAMALLSVRTVAPVAMYPSTTCFSGLLRSLWSAR